MCICGLHYRITARDQLQSSDRNSMGEKNVIFFKRNVGGRRKWDGNKRNRGAEARNNEVALQSKGREVKRVWTEEQSRLEGKQIVLRIPSTFLAETERRDERRGCSEQWRTSTEYQRENKC